jgi:peptide/nickel transport system substrate-binding protein
VFQQLYFRQAFQHLVDQPGWIHAFYHGDGVPTYGPVPIVPQNPFADSLELQHNPYPFSIPAAAQLLKSHGWDVRPGGVTTCARPGSGPDQCGAGIPAGLGLSFNLDYVTNSSPLASAMLDLKSEAAHVGIQLQLSVHPYSTVATVTVPCKPTQSDCGWTLENWAVGWIYGPDYDPTGEELFKTGAAVNFSSYDSTAANKLIEETITAPPSTSQAALDAYQNYLAEQLPVVWEPVTAGNPIAGGLTLVSRRLGGYTTNSFGSINPEFWYLIKQ